MSDKYKGWLLDVLRNKKLHLDGSYTQQSLVTSWQLIRYLLATRASCKQHRFDVDQCVIKMLTQHLPNNVRTKYGEPEKTFVILAEILKPEVMNIFVDDFRQGFNLSSPIDITNNLSLQKMGSYLFRHDIDEKELSRWLQQWLSKLQPGDLRSDITIRY